MMDLRLELFVGDLESSIEFYRRVHNFVVEKQDPDGYTSLSNGGTKISLNRLDSLMDDHPIYISENDRPGRGVEIVLAVDDVESMYNHVLSQNWPVLSGLKRQAWELVDFRVTDPGGYYLRVTSK